MRWDDYDYKDPCLSTWKDVKTNIGLSDDLFNPHARSSEKECKKYGLKKARKAPQYTQALTSRTLALGSGQSGGHRMGLPSAPTSRWSAGHCELTLGFVLALGRAATQPWEARSGCVVPRETAASQASLLECAPSSQGLPPKGGRRTVPASLPTPAIARLAAGDGAGRRGRIARSQPVRRTTEASPSPPAVASSPTLGRGGPRSRCCACSTSPSRARRSRRRRGARSWTAHATEVERVRGASHDLLGSIGGRGLDGFQVVVDCANGAASSRRPARAALARRRRRPSSTPARRRQHQRTSAGPTHPEGLQEAVVRLGRRRRPGARRRRRPRARRRRRRPARRRRPDHRHLRHRPARRTAS